MSYVDRFEAKFEKNLNCWIWRGTKDGKGYGIFSIKHIYYPAHRVSYELYVDKIPEGMVIDHLCRVPLCVNPDHLEPVTIRENSLRGTSPNWLAFKKGTCRLGHPKAQFAIKSDGTTGYCKQCNRVRQREVYRLKVGGTVKPIARKYP